MPTWRKRNPDSFLAIFHSAMRLGELDKHLLFSSFTEKEVRRMQRQWKLFMYCLRESPLHPLHTAACENTYVTRVSWNAMTNLWELRLTAHHSILQDMLPPR